MTKKKKVIVLSCMIALLAVTAVFNYVLSGTKSSENVSEMVTASTYFSQYRTERLTTRSTEMSELDAIISAAVVDSTEYNSALEMKRELTKITENELYLETLIKAYGFNDCVVTIGLDTSNINVMVESANLSDDDAVLIYSIIEDEKIGSVSNVKIIPIS